MKDRRALASRLDRRITIQRAVADDNGVEETIVWQDWMTVWAAYMPVKGVERFELLGREQSAPATFEIRWQREIAAASTSMRIVFDGRAYDVKSVFEVGRHVSLRIDTIRGD